MCSVLTCAQLDGIGSALSQGLRAARVTSRIRPRPPKPNAEQGCSMQSKVALKQIAIFRRPPRQVSANSSASKTIQLPSVHTQRRFTEHFDEVSGIFGTISLAKLPTSDSPLMSTRTAVDPSAISDDTVSLSSPPLPNRGPSTAGQDRQTYTRPPVPSEGLRRPPTVANLQELIQPFSRLKAPSSSAPDLALSPEYRAGGRVLTSAAVRPKSAPSVAPSPGSRSAGTLTGPRLQPPATAAVMDTVSCTAEAQEELASRTGVPVFCMMPLDTVRLQTQ